MKQRFIKTANLIKENKFLIPKERQVFDIQFDNKPYKKGLNQVTKTLNNMSIQFNLLYENALNKGPDRIEDELGQIRIILEPEIYNKIMNEIKEINNFILIEINEQKSSLNQKLNLKLKDLKEKEDKELIEILTKHKQIISSLHTLIEIMEHIINTYNYITEKMNKIITINERIKKEIKYEEEKAKIFKHNLKYYKENIRALEMKMDLMSEKKEENQIKKKIQKSYKNLPRISYSKKINEDPKRITYYSTLSTSNNNTDYENFNNSYNLLRRTLNNFNNRTFFITRQQKKNNSNEKKQSFKNESEKNLFLLNNYINKHIESSKIKIDNANKTYNSVFHIKKKENEELREYYNDPVYRRIFMEKIFQDENIISIINQNKLKTIITDKLTIEK